MLYQPFAMAIVNDLFDEDLDPDLFREAADEVLAELAAGECDGSPDAQATHPFLVAVAPRPGRLS